MIEPGQPTRLAVLVSGGGSNLMSLHEATRDPSYGAEIAVVIADRDDTGGIDFAVQHKIPTAVLRVSDYESRQAWDVELARILGGHDVDLVVSAGFLKLLGPAVLEAFPGRVVNTHNALLPAFPGIHGPRDALDYGVRVAGATLFVVDGGVDTGPIIAQCVVEVRDDDTEETLTERIKVAERAQLVDYIGRMSRSGWTIMGRRARPISDIRHHQS